MFLRYSLSVHDTLHLPSLFVFLYRLVPEAGLLLNAWSFTARMVLRQTRFYTRRQFGSPKFPSYPCEYMPWSKTPVVPYTHRHVGISTYLTCSGLLPSDHLTPSAFPINTTMRYPNDHNHTNFGVQYTACILVPPSFVLPLRVLHVDVATNLLAKL